jgi:hypothetical protein
MFEFTKKKCLQARQLQLNEAKLSALSHSRQRRDREAMRRLEVTYSRGRNGFISSHSELDHCQKSFCLIDFCCRSVVRCPFVKSFFCS